MFPCHLNFVPHFIKIVTNIFLNLPLIQTDSSETFFTSESLMFFHQISSVFIKSVHNTVYLMNCSSTKTRILFLDCPAGCVMGNPRFQCWLENWASAFYGKRYFSGFIKHMTWLCVKIGKCRQSSNSEYFLLDLLLPFSC